MKQRAKNERIINFGIDVKVAIGVSRGDAL
jgi:hypothetical protein